MADDLQPLFVLGRDDLQFRVVFNPVAGIDQSPIDLSCHGRLGESRTNRGSDILHADRAFELADATVRQGDVDHGSELRNCLQLILRGRQ